MSNYLENIQYQLSGKQSHYAPLLMNPEYSYQNIPNTYYEEQQFQNNQGLHNQQLSQPLQQAPQIMPVKPFQPYEHPPMKRYSVSYPMAANLPMTYQTRTLPYTSPEDGAPQTSIPLMYLSFPKMGPSQQYYKGNYYPVMKDDFLSDLLPTVAGFRKLEDPIDTQPVPIETRDFGNKEIFEVFQEKLANLKHVKLVRTNTLPKEETSKNIVKMENNHRKTYFNLEYPTVSISFVQPISNVMCNWMPHEKTETKRRLVMFYWDFSLERANHVINNGPEDMYKEKLEYSKSVLRLNYEVITEQEYKLLFEGGEADLQNDFRLQHLALLVRDNEGGLKSNFCVISCLYWNYTNGFYLTSVELLFLLDKLSGRTTNVTNSVAVTEVSVPGGLRRSKFSKQQAKRYKQQARVLKAIDQKEVNRIRRNLISFKSITLGKESEEMGFGGSEEEMAFFHTIMGFNNPKPRKIEKKLKVYEWSIVETALDKIMKKYCVDLKTDGLDEGLMESGFY